MYLHMQSACIMYYFFSFPHIITIHSAFKTSDHQKLSKCLSVKCTYLLSPVFSGVCTVSYNVTVSLVPICKCLPLADTKMAE